MELGKHKLYNRLSTFPSLYEAMVLRNCEIVRHCTKRLEKTEKDWKSLQTCVHTDAKMCWEKGLPLCSVRERRGCGEASRCGLYMFIF